MNKFAKRSDQALRILTRIFAVVKVVTAPFWFIPWMVLKGLVVLLPLLLLGFLSGCTSTSNHFDKSPCACEFRPLNTIDLGGNRRA
jgi:hypothetical protein